MTRNKQEYRSMSVDQIMALTDDETRRDYLETLLREHVSDANEKTVIAALEKALDDDETLQEIDTTDPDDYLTALLDGSTDDGIATVLRTLVASVSS